MAGGNVRFLPGVQPRAGDGNDLSPSATARIIQRWQTEPGSVMIRTLNRTSGSLEQLLDTANAENVDLILTSSPMLLQHLQEHQSWRYWIARLPPARSWCRVLSAQLQWR